VIQIPSYPGAYALGFSLSEPLRLGIGRLGEAFFPAGQYVYLGSACGPGGLQARLGRHLSGNIARPHWHIDYLRPFVTVRTYCYLVSKPSSMPHTSLECLWSQALLKLPYASAPVNGFGSSDCRSGCRAHLVALGDQAILPNPKSFLEALSCAAGRSISDLVYVALA
jgi:Uri superfamily endonuclease